MKRVIQVFLIFAAGVRLSAQVAPVSENVIVSAGLSPQTPPAVSAAVTVITRDEIEKSGKTSVLELLREVPGVDVVESGGAGAVTSVFLRGANSTQTLVLVDGVRVNRPDFAGYDFSALSAQNVERIEIARGPFSALYGSDAIGGVISILTRSPRETPSGRFTAAAGNKNLHEETLFASAGLGDVAFALSGRDAYDGGDVQTVAGTRVDNSAWRDQNGSARVQWSPDETFRTGISVERMFARTGIPSDGAVATPDNFTDFAQTTWTVPIEWRTSIENSLHASLWSVAAHPTSFGPDGQFPYSSDTQARTLGGRAADTWTLSGQTISVAASYESSRVDLSDSYGVELNDDRVHTWGAAAEDRIPLLSGKLLAVAGVRYDRHSAFGSSTNPRLSFVFALDEADSLRASYGTAFRAPSIGELYYPVFGNPDLRPEKSRNFEIGFERRAGEVAIDLSAFRNEVRDLIQYDFSTQSNDNVGRARMEGIEAAAAAPLGRTLLARLSYTELRATDESTGLPLLRRPRHRGSLDLTWSQGALRVGASAIYTGRRADRDSATFADIEDPSYLRIDLAASYRLGAFAPFVRLQNLTDRRYAEADGYPAPRLRAAAGIEASF